MISGAFEKVVGKLRGNYKKIVGKNAIKINVGKEGFHVHLIFSCRVSCHIFMSYSCRVSYFFPFFSQTGVCFMLWAAFHTLSNKKNLKKCIVFVSFGKNWFQRNGFFWGKKTRQWQKKRWRKSLVSGKNLLQDENFSVKIISPKSCAIAQIAKFGKNLQILQEISDEVLVFPVSQQWRNVQEAFHLPFQILAERLKTCRTLQNQCKISTYPPLC